MTWARATELPVQTTSRNSAAVDTNSPLSDIPGHSLRAQVLRCDRNLLKRSAVHWPSKLIIVRHGQSAGNIARDTAHETASDRFALSVRDAALPLRDLGPEQTTSRGSSIRNAHVGTPVTNAHLVSRLYFEQRH